MKSWPNRILGFGTCILLASIMGMLSVVLPPHVIGHIENGGDPYALVPFIDKGLQHAEPLPSALFLFITGLIMGYYRPAYWLLSGIATVVLFPIYASVEMTLRPTSHNLWPIEFLIYAAFSLPALVGAFIGSLGRRKLKETDNGTQPPPAPRTRSPERRNEP